MQKAKKIFLLLLIQIILVSLYACGRTSETAGMIPTLKWYVHGEVQPDQERVNKEINKILEDKAGCHLDIIYLDPQVYAEKMQMLMASNDTYDLCFTGYVNTYKKAAQKGGLLALDGYLDDFPGIREAIPEYALEAAKIDGKIYAIPNIQIMAQCTGLFINKELFEEYGQMDVEDISGVEDVEPFLEWVKNTHPEIHAFGLGDARGWKKKFDYKLISEICLGVDIIEKGGKIEAVRSFSTREKLYEAKKIREYFEKGYMRPDIAVYDSFDSDNICRTSAVWRGVYKPGASAELYERTGIETICIPVSQPIIRHDTGKTTMTGVGRYSRYPDKAMRIIELMNTDKELYNLVCFGIEGVHYKMKDEKHIEKIPDSGYNVGNSWMFGKQFNALLLEGQEDDVWEQTERFNENAEVSPIMGFSFDTTAVSREIAGIETIYEQYTAFTKGFEPLEAYYDEFVSELENVGIDNVVNEVNRQLEEFFEYKK